MYNNYISALSSSANTSSAASSSPTTSLRPDAPHPKTGGSADSKDWFRPKSKPVTDGRKRLGFDSQKLEMKPAVMRISGLVSGGKWFTTNLYEKLCGLFGDFYSHWIDLRWFKGRLTENPGFHHPAAKGSPVMLVMFSEPNYMFLASAASVSYVCPISGGAQAT